MTDQTESHAGAAQAGPARRDALRKAVTAALLLAAVAGVLIARQWRPLPVPHASPASQAAPAAASLPRLVDLGAGKCIPCKMMAPILESLKAEQAGKLEVVFIDVWENPGAGEPYGIKMIPTQIFYDASGQELFRHEGFFAKEDILAKWKALGVALNQAPAPAPAAPQAGG